MTMLSGFGSHFSTEAVAGALPAARNSPQKVAYGLYAEQLSGTAFTAPRHENRRSWLYRLRPTAAHARFEPYSRAPLASERGALRRGAAHAESPPLEPAADPVRSRPTSSMGSSPSPVTT